MIESVTKKGGIWESLLAIRHTGCPISDTSAEIPSVSVQNVSRVNSTGSQGQRLLYLNGDSSKIEMFAKKCRDHDHTTSFKQVSESIASEAYYTMKMQFSDGNPSILSLLNSNGVFNYGSINVHRGTEHWLVYSRQKPHIETLVGEIEKYDNRVQIYRLVNLNESHDLHNIKFDSILSELTTKQKTTFETALRMNYYEDESDTTIADISEKLGLHETTTWEHLSKAENEILTNIGDRIFTAPDKTLQ